MSHDPGPPESRRREIWQERVTRLGVLLLAILCTAGAYRFPHDGILPTVAFSSWAFLFLRHAIDLPGDWGLLPAGDEMDEATPSDNAPPQDDRDGVA